MSIECGGVKIKTDIDMRNLFYLSLGSTAKAQWTGKGRKVAFGFTWRSNFFLLCSLHASWMSHRAMYCCVGCLVRCAQTAKGASENFITFFLPPSSTIRNYSSANKAPLEESDAQPFPLCVRSVKNLFYCRADFYGWTHLLLFMLCRPTCKSFSRVAFRSFTDRTGDRFVNHVKDVLGNLKEFPS